MNKFTVFAVVGLAAAVAIPALSQDVSPPTSDPARVIAGTYETDDRHNQVVWEVNHLGFSQFHGMFRDPDGFLTIDPANPEASVVSIDIPVDHLVTTNENLDNHMRNADFFDMPNHPMVTFRSTSVEVDGDTAKITGDLTMRGVTNSVVLDTRLVGVGVNTRSGRDTIGFYATTSVNRSDYGMTYGLPALGDNVDIIINAAFERVVEE